MSGLVLIALVLVLADHGDATGNGDDCNPSASENRNLLPSHGTPEYGAHGLQS